MDSILYCLTELANMELGKTQLKAAFESLEIILLANKEIIQEVEICAQRLFETMSLDPELIIEEIVPTLLLEKLKHSTNFSLMNLLVQNDKLIDSRYIDHIVSLVYVSEELDFVTLLTSIILKDQNALCYDHIHYILDVLDKFPTDQIISSSHKLLNLLKLMMERLDLEFEHWGKIEKILAKFEQATDRSVLEFTHDMMDYVDQHKLRESNRDYIYLQKQLF